jgi:alkane 1-monooxygenase
MHWRVFKYCSPLIIFSLAWLSFTGRGWVCFLPLLWTYVLIPFVELFLQPDTENMEQAEEEVARLDNRFDYLLYAVVFFQYASVILFLFSLQTPGLTWVDYTGRIFSMGLLCGIFGINVGHELGHRPGKLEQFLAKMLLLSSQYLHFFIEHNKGHHKRVATAEDPASSRLGESLYAFYPRTILYSYLGAWQIANKETVRKGNDIISLHNEMVRYTLIQFSFLVLIGYFFGLQLLLYYWLAAAIGIGLLEAVNYIEHYGLSRKEIAPGKYERAMPVHSWNSNHLLGRLMLFELSRHSDHHYLASRKFQVLRHHDDAPQMPTGYPGMMILAHLPPLFFYVMKKQMKKLDLTTSVH